MDLEREFNGRAPWITRFEIDGRTYGGDFEAMKDARIEQFFAAFPNVRSVLELGSLEGGHSFALSRNSRVERITAVEARDFNIEKALFIKSILRDEKVSFVQLDVEKGDLGALGSFDAVFCSGILYHLPEPWKLIEQCARVARNIFIWTQYACENEVRKTVNGYRGRWYKEGGWRDPLSGVSKWSFWLSMGSLANLLTASGYDQITIIENNLTHPKGCAVTLAARNTTLANKDQAG